MATEQSSAAGAPNASHAVGFTIMRTGQGDDARACIVAPYGGRIDSITLEGDALKLKVGKAEMVVGPLPDAVLLLMKDRPQSVLLLSVDSLARVRMSTHMGGALPH